MFKKIKILVVSALVISSIFGLLVSENSFAHTATISTSGSVLVDVSVSGNGANVGSDSINVVSTCPLGYTVSISGPSDNTLYLNGDSTSPKTIPASTGTLAAPASILGNNLGTWGYTTEANATINSNFIGLTNTAAQLVTKASASATGGDNINVFYGVSVLPTTAPGNYTLAESSQGAGDNAIVYALIPNVNCANYTIRYNDNGANSTTTMGITHNVVENDEVTLAASNYQRANYGFAGWSTVALDPDSSSFQTDLATAKAAGKVFGPNETVTVDATLLSQPVVENGVQYITLYAIWVKPAQNAVLQNWQGCSSLNNGDVIALRDQRDNDVYAVAKLADGKCWMIENLRLDADASHNTDGLLAQGYGGVFAGLAESESGTFQYITTANSLYYIGTQSGTATINVGSYNGPQYRIPRYNNANTDPTTVTSSTTATNQTTYSYGNVYSWPAAIADTTYYDTINTSVTSTSICPKGWRLPLGGNKSNEANNEFWNLIVEEINNGINPDNYSDSWAPYYSGTEGNGVSKLIRKYPNNFIYSGWLSDARATGEHYRGTAGRYWTSTVKDDSIAFTMYLGNTLVYPGNDRDASVVNIFDTGKYNGRTIRCIAE